MAYTLPNGSTFQVASVFAPALAVTSISNTAEAVVSTATNTYAIGDYLYLTTGWAKLTGRVFRAKAVTATTVTLEGVNTTSTTLFPSGSSAGSIKKISTWVEIPQITAVDFSGGEQSMLDLQFMADDFQRQIPTVKSSLSMTLTVADDPAQAFVPVVKGFDESRAISVGRLNLVNGSVILYPSYFTFSPTPTISLNELLVNTVNLAVQGLPTRYDVVV